MSVQFFKSQLRLLQGHAEDEPITTARKEQDLVGTLLQWGNHASVRFADMEFENFRAAMAEPVEKHGGGMALYLHGGGYVCGDLSYAKGFGSVLCREAGIQVLCPAYRLAPEFPFPAALDDAVTAYRYLLNLAPAEKIVVIGESAGGGLLLSLCLEAKRLGLPQPAGLVCMSPWTDLTGSGASYAENESVDPSMTRARLQRYAAYYSDNLQNPLVSPLFGDLTGLPDTLIFAGSLEIMLDDARGLHEALQKAGCRSEMTIAPDMWHGYVLYGFKERQEDMDRICRFIREQTT
ncbi:MAG: alpha/beta hydrolase [Oscillospiraceae bacterium]|nr:alpha/beta hydrolase [Oscillospiraceae bacterium]